jgi:hypothetical protein
LLQKLQAFWIRLLGLPTLTVAFKSEKQLTSGQRQVTYIVSYRSFSEVSASDAATKFELEFKKSPIRNIKITQVVLATRSDTEDDVAPAVSGWQHVVVVKAAATSTAAPDTTEAETDAATDATEAATQATTKFAGFTTAPRRIANLVQKTTKATTAAPATTEAVTDAETDAPDAATDAAPAPTPAPKKFFGFMTQATSAAPAATDAATDAETDATDAATEATQAPTKKFVGFATSARKIANLVQHTPARTTAAPAATEAVTDEETDVPEATTLPAVATTKSAGFSNRVAVKIAEVPEIKIKFVTGGKTQTGNVKVASALVPVITGGNAPAVHKTCGDDLLPLYDAFWLPVNNANENDGYQLKIYSAWKSVLEDGAKVQVVVIDSSVGDDQQKPHNVWFWVLILTSTPDRNLAARFRKVLAIPAAAQNGPSSDQQVLILQDAVSLPKGANVDINAYVVKIERIWRLALAANAISFDILRVVRHDDVAGEDSQTETGDGSIDLNFALIVITKSTDVGFDNLQPMFYNYLLTSSISALDCPSSCHANDLAVAPEV